MVDNSTNIRIVNPDRPEPKPNPFDSVAEEARETIAIGNAVLRQGADILTGENTHRENILKAKGVIAQLLASPERGGVLSWKGVGENERRKLVRDLVKATFDHQLGWKLPKTETVMKFVESLPQAITEAISQFKVKVHLGDENWIGIPSDISVRIKAKADDGKWTGKGDPFDANGVLKAKADEAGIKLPKDPLLVSDIITETDPGKFDEKLWKEIVVLMLKKTVLEHSGYMTAPSERYLSEKRNVALEQIEQDVLDQRSFAPDEHILDFRNPSQFKTIKGAGPAPTYDPDSFDPVSEAASEEAHPTFFDTNIIAPTSEPTQESLRPVKVTITKKPARPAPVPEQSVAPHEYVEALPDPDDKVTFKNDAKFDRPKAVEKTGVFEINLMSAGSAHKKEFMKILSGKLGEILIELQHGNPEDLKKWLEFAKKEGGNQGIA